MILYLRIFFQFFYFKKFFFQMSQMNTVAALRHFIRPCFWLFFSKFFFQSFFFKGCMHRRLGDRIASPHFLARMPSFLGRAKPWPNFQGIMQNCIGISMSIPRHLGGQEVPENGFIFRRPWFTCVFWSPD